MRVLVTRPRSRATRTAERLSALGHEALLDPVVEIDLLAFDLPSTKFDVLAFTSANAVQTAASFETLKSIPVYAVGARTAEAASEAGFRVVGVASGDVKALGELLAAELREGARVLHLAGEDRAGDLPAYLAQRGIIVETVVVYRARVAKTFSPETVKSLRAGAIGAVLHYSERSAAAFVRLADAAGIADDIRKTRHLCLSANVAGPLKLSGAPFEIAATPDETTLLGLLDA